MKYPWRSDYFSTGFLLFLYFTHFPPLSLVFVVRFLKFCSKNIKLYVFPIDLMKHSWQSDCLLAGFWLFLYFYIFPHIFCVFGPI